MFSAKTELKVTTILMVAMTAMSTIGTVILSALAFQHAINGNELSYVSVPASIAAVLMSIYGIKNAKEAVEDYKWLKEHTL